MLSVTLVHPAKAVGWNEVPFGRDTFVVLINTVLDRALVPTWEEKIWGSKTLVRTLPYCHITLALVIIAITLYCVNQ